MRKLSKFILPIAITVFLVAILLSFIDPYDVLRVLVSADLKLLLIAFIAYFIMLALRGIRFRLLLKNKITFTDITSIVFLYNFVSLILPFKLGELSYAYFIKKTGKESYTHGFTSLILVKIMDFIIILLFLILLLFFDIRLRKDFFLLLLVASFFLLLSLALFLTLILNTRAIISIFDSIYKIKFIKKIRFFSSIKEKIKNFIKYFQEYKSRHLLTSFLLTVFIWFSGYLFTIFIVLSLKFQTPLYFIITAFSFVTISNILPIHGFANIGTIESIWVVLLVYFGILLQEAVLLSFGVQIITFIMTGIFGVIGWISISTKVLQKK